MKIRQLNACFKTSLVLLGISISLSQMAYSQCGTGPCKVCNVSAVITEIIGGEINVGTSTIMGNIGAGESGIGDTLEITATTCGAIRITVELDFDWRQGTNVNWIHGVSFLNSPAWGAADGYIIPFNAGWRFVNSIQGKCSANNYNAGYFWDPIGSTCPPAGNLSNWLGGAPGNCSNAQRCEGNWGYLIEGDPSDNWGIDCTTNCPKFGFRLTYCPNTGGSAVEEITWYITEDGETGAWFNSDGCIFELTFPIKINAAGIQFPEEFGPICEGDCIEINAGEGCLTYTWNTGQTGSFIEVCPTETTTYSVTVTGEGNCEITGQTVVLTEFCCEPDAGELSVDPTIVCPGDVINWSTSDFNESASYIQKILIVDANGVITEIHDPYSGTFTWSECASFTVYAYNYHISGGAPEPSIGMNISEISCSVDCCELISQEISFEDTESPTFIAPPSSITLTCIDELEDIEDLSWTDNCGESGSAVGQQSGSSTLCDGGTITRTWNATDGCGNESEHVQTITILPAEPVQFINPPGNTSVNCDEIPSSPGNLDYSNSTGNDCEISGDVAVVSVENFDICGGTITNTWTLTDTCSRTVEHVQIITVNPAPAAQFIDPPASTTILCADIPTGTPPVLNYTNGLSGDCAIEGSVDAVVSGSADLCGGAITYIWSFTDACGRTISHTQTLTVNPVPEAQFVNPPASTTIQCADIPSGAPPALSYTNGLPGDCAIQGSVDAVVSGSADLCGGTITYVWSFTDVCGRAISHTQVLTVNPVPQAQFVDPPQSITVQCADIPTSAPDLTITNGLSGDCLIEAVVPATVSGSANLCGGTITYTWTHTDACGRTTTHVQNITVQPVPQAQFVDPPQSTTVQCADIPTSAPDLTITNGLSGDCLIEAVVSATVSGSANLCGGTITYTWTHTDACGRTTTHVQTITASIVPQAQFVDPPQSTTVQCSDIPTSAPDLTITNGLSGDCLIEAVVPATVSGSANLCGGTITYTWTHTDACGRTTTHVQTITASIVPQAQFVDPPQSNTVQCADIPTSAPDLLITNGLSGNCLIEAVVPATVSGSANLCGGTITYTWTFTDPCGRTTTHVQTITASIVPQAQFVDPPQSITVNCGEEPGPAQPMLLTNGLSGSCLIEAMVPPITTGGSGICGGTITNTWSFTDPCGRLTQHVQTIVVNPAPPAVFDDLPPNIIVECGNVPPGLITLNYSNGLSGSCAIQGSVSPSVSGFPGLCGGTITHTWSFTDPCGRNLSHSRTITVLPALEATFINPPADITFECSESVAPPQALSYTNGLGGTCAIEGEITPLINGSAGICGGSIAYIWSFTDPCARLITHTQIITVQPTPEPFFINPPSDITLSCDQAEQPIPPLSYSNGESDPQCIISGQVDGTLSGSYNACGGLLLYTWNYTDPCGRSISHTQFVFIDEAPQVEFSSLPQDITVSCYEVPQPNTQLAYSNNLAGSCNISGSIFPTDFGYYDGCGGALFFTWSFTDDCGRTTEHVQTITIEPVGTPAFINPPADITVSCQDAFNLQLNQNLEYNNGEFGLCEVYGSTEPIVFGVPNTCGDLIQVLWSQLVCDSIIEHLQIITILPASPPAFINPPADLTLNCGEPFPNPQDLAYQNNETAPCSVNGSVSPAVSVNGNVQTLSWSFTDPCGQTISHTQNITRLIFPNISFQPNSVSICLGNTIDLATLTIVDANNTNPSITYHSASPATPANQLANTTVQPTITTTYYALATSTGGCTDEAAITIVVDNPASAGNDNQDILCFEASNVNFWDYLGPDFSTGGAWSDLNNSGVDLSNPANVSFIGTNPGNYTYLHIVPANGACPPDTATLSIQLLQEIIISIDSVRCNSDLESYTVYINGNGYNISVSAGTLLPLGNDRYQVTDLDTSITLIITASIPNTSCSNTFTVNPPNCNCPDVLPPVSGGNFVICQGEPNPTLTVTVDPDNTANWYDSPSGGILLLGNSTSYTPTQTTPGVYRFYVEAQNIDLPECKSPTRTQITLDIRALPNVTNATIEACDPDGDGFASFDLNAARTLINNNPANTFSFHLTLQDAQNGDNPLNSPYTNVQSPQQTLFVAVTNASNCTSIAQLTLLVLPNMTITINTTRASCPGDTDGSATISATSGTGSKEYSLNNMTWSTNNTFQNLAPGNYTAYVRDEKGCVQSQPFTIQPGMSIDISQFDILCDNNGTATDPNDDFYTITFTLNHNYGNTGSFTLLVNGTPFGPFAYDSPNSITLPADGNSYTFLFTDTDFNCEVSQNTGNLNPCSTDCLITISLLEKICNDNGTPSDPSDDFYTITVNASAINPGPSNSFIIFINGIPQGTFPYGTGGSFTLPADGSNPVVTFRDTDIDQCAASRPLGVLSTCSDLCVITAVIDSLICDDLGTTNDPLDDTFLLFITNSGLNTANSWYIQGNPGITFQYNQSIQFGPYLIANGPFTLTLVDSNDPNCTFQLLITPPPPCSDPCEIEAYDLSIGDCDDNQTGPISDDDFFSVSFRIRVNEGSVSQFNVVWNGQSFGPFDYDQLVTLDNLPANGATITIVITDLNNPSCRTTIQVSSDPCSSCDQFISAGDDQLITCQDSTAQLNGSASHAPLTISWSGPDNFSASILNPIVDEPGWYFLTVSYPDLCTFTDSVFVDIDANIPTADAGPDRLLTCIILQVTLGGSNTSSGPNLIYQWTDASGNIIGTDPTLIVTNPGEYFLQVIDTLLGCRSPRDRVIVNQNITPPAAPIYANPGELLNCVVFSILLTSDPQDNASYTWTVNGVPFTQPSVSINEPGTITLIVTDTLNGCTNSNSITIQNAVEYPIIAIDPPNPLNCIDTTTIIDASKSQNNPDIIYQWFDPNGNLLPESGNILTVSATGYYYLTLRDTLNGCENTDSVLVTSNAEYPQISAGPNIDISCLDSIATLLGSGTDILPEFTINWSTTTGNIRSGQNTFNPSVDGPGYYYLTVFNPENGCRSTDSTFVRPNFDAPIIQNLQIDSIFCFGDNGAIQLLEIDQGTPPYTILLNGRPTNNSGILSPLRPGTYSISVIDAKGCSTDTTITLDPGRQLTLDVETRLLVQLGDSAILEAFVNIPESEIASINWTPPQFFSCDTCLRTTVFPLNTREYLITVVDINGCVVFEYVLIFVEKDIRIFVPNAFTPNSDGNNDGFTIFTDDQVKIIREARIFDRWGGLMFYKENFPPNDPSLGWDGTFEGKPVTLGVYVYYFIVELQDGTTEVLSGDVTVLTWD